MFEACLMAVYDSQCIGQKNHIELSTFGKLCKLFIELVIQYTVRVRIRISPSGYMVANLK